MKYIRTKEGIYEFPKGFTEFNWNNKTLLENEEHIVWTGGEVIAQADTIEELCDEAVFFSKNNKPHYKSQEGNLWYLGASLFTESLRFGIFTDKGLIYVAKMNEKGKLELL